MPVESKENWKELISQPKYRVKTEKRIRVPMRDGVHLSVDVFRPDASEKFPALVAMSPYWNEAQYLPVPPAKIHPYSGLGNHAIECGDTNYLVARGYAHVVVNVRGTGESEGEYQLMGPVEARDGYDLIEWIARQPWCNGNVGMVGVSYFSWIQYLVAAQNPPHLKAIFPLEGACDFYRDVCYHGGILSLGFLFRWSTEITDNNNVIQSERELSREEIRRRVEELRERNEDIRNIYFLYHLLCAPRKYPLLFDALLHPTDGQWYWERSPYTYFGKIRVPTYCGSPLNHFDLHLPGGFSAWERLDVKKRFIIYPEFLERPFHQHHDLIIRWYDHWLKGIDTGIMDEPPITLWVNGRNEWRQEYEWPLKRTQWKKLYLRAGGLLSEKRPESGELPTDSFQNISYLTAADIDRPVPRCQYSTDAFSNDFETTGPWALYLYASLDNTDCHWIPEVCDVSPEGKRRLVTRGYLKASFREADKARSKPYRPWHPYTKQVPVEPNKIEEYAIQIHDNSNVFLPGHRLRLDIKSVDHAFEGGPSTTFYHLYSSKKVTHTIYHTAEHPSYLLVPVVPPKM